MPLLTKALATSLLLLAALLQPSLALADSYKILIIGDSLSHTNGVPVDKRWLTGLRQLLDQNGTNFEVINLSKSGGTTRYARSVLTAQLRVHKPDMVLVQLGNVDSIMGYKSSYIAENLSNIIGKIRHAGATPILVGFDMPSGLRGSTGKSLAATFKKVAQRTRTQLAEVNVHKQTRVLELSRRDVGYIVKLAQRPLLDAIWPVMKPIVPGKGRKL